MPGDDIELLRQTLGVPPEAGAGEFLLIKASSVGQSPLDGEAGRVTSSGSGFDVSFPSGCSLRVEMDPASGVLRSGRLEVVACELDEPFIVMLRFRLANQTQPYFMIPAVLYGTNNADRGATNRFKDELGCGDLEGYGGDPQLAYRAGTVDAGRRLSPAWHFRADRSAVPFVAATFDGQLVALGVQEASDGRDNDWVYNALGLWTDAKRGDAITITMGSLDWPGRIINHEMDDQPVLEPFDGGRAVGMKTGFFICHRRASDRFAYESVLVDWYQYLRESPRPGASLPQAMRDVASALIHDGIHPQRGYFHMYRQPEGIATTATLLAWAGVYQIARPLLRAGRILEEPEYVDVTAAMVDRAVEDAYNPKAGLFHEVHWKDRWQPNNWWPTLGHVALINGHACHLLLKMHDDDGTHSNWAEAARRVLGSILKHQRPDGRFPVGFSTEDGTPSTYLGYGGCFFVAPLLMIYRQFTDSTARDAGLRALEHYWEEFTQLEWRGVDLDCRGAVDCGSSYALIRALVEIHQQTGDPQMLSRLGHVLHYACSYRLGHNTRHRNPVCDWSSAGCTVTSTHNIHVDTYGGEILEDMQYYVDQTGDPYFRSRIEDSLAWARQAYNRTENEYGWGKVGWVPEQYYHTFDRYHHPEGDGMVWLSYFPWAGGSLLNHFVLEAERYTRPLAAMRDE